MGQGFAVVVAVHRIRVACRRKGLRVHTCSLCGAGVWHGANKQGTAHKFRCSVYLAFTPIQAKMRASERTCTHGCCCLLLQRHHQHITP